MTPRVRQEVRNTGAIFGVAKTAIPDCYEIRPRIHDDERGRFVKVFHRDAFTAHHLNVHYAEEYYSVSARNVIRGLHFQIPPMDQVKLVYCVAGRVQDVALDLRTGSPTYGRHISVELSSESGNMLYLSPGIAHGFCTLTDSAILVYKVSTQHSANHDKGVKWDSAGVQWATASPILSERDQDHPPLAAFVSPFQYDPTT
jgi:dTDP-4-dehydrorhamnose 3,5-epimerase